MKQVRITPDPRITIATVEVLAASVIVWPSLKSRGAVLCVSIPPKMKLKLLTSSLIAGGDGFFL